jgi:hypothetical protein
MIEDFEVESGERICLMTVTTMGWRNALDRRDGVGRAGGDTLDVVECR